jgi:hypothetical protein
MRRREPPDFAAARERRTSRDVKCLTDRAANDARQCAPFIAAASLYPDNRTDKGMPTPMNRKPDAIAAGRLAIALTLVLLSAGTSFAGTNGRKVVIVVHPRHVVRVPVSPYAPYYYSRWNPHSLYSIYDHLSGGRQLCRLPSEPCDNDHRLQN